MILRENLWGGAKRDLGRGHNDLLLNCYYKVTNTVEKLKKFMQCMLTELELK